ncbi:MAG: FHA domain-containing protein [Muribaculaceae bacterium]
MDYNNKVRIKCPCGANLILPKTPGMEAKTFTCPVCHQPHPFTEYTLLPPRQPNPAPVPAPKPAPAQPKTIDVICPCGAKLRVKQTTEIQSKSITCPKCGQKRPFSEYQLPGQAKSPIDIGDPLPGGTVVTNSGVNAPTQLLDMTTGKVYGLKVGENVVGRMADSSKAEIQIETEDKKLSREHFVITAKIVGNGKYKYFLKLYKAEVNTTKVNDQIMEFGDEIFLQNGTKILIHHTTLMFQVQDMESTIC